MSANDNSVRLELQADCFAGAWASSVAERGLFDPPGEIDEALDAAASVGDDRIQADAGMTVDPESFTHGSAAQRRQWFQTGFRRPGELHHLQRSARPCTLSVARAASG